MHLSRPSAYRLSWCRTWNLGLVVVFSNGYCSVTVGLNIDEMVTPKPATGASAWPMPFFAGLSGWYPGAGAAGYQPLRPAKKGIGQALAPVAGFGVTISSMFKPTVTEQYPFEKTPTKPRFH